MEHWENLKPGGFRFVWAEGLFRPGTDTFLLSSLPRLKPGLRLCDLGCGTGLLGLLLLQREAEMFVTGVEIQPEAVRLAEEAVRENGLQDRFTVRLEDLRETALPAGSFDLAVCNPPYYPPQSGCAAADAARRTARSETACTLSDVCRTAARLVRWGGAFCLVHKPERLTDLLCTLRETGWEPKRLRFASRTPEAAPSLLLLEARRGGKPGLTIEPPLFLQTMDGKPSPELERIYFRQEAPL